MFDQNDQEFCASTQMVQNRCIAHEVSAGVCKQQQPFRYAKDGQQFCGRCMWDNERCLLHEQDAEECANPQDLSYEQDSDPEWCTELQPYSETASYPCCTGQDVNSCSEQVFAFEKDGQHICGSCKWEDDEKSCIAVVEVPADICAQKPNFMYEVNGEQVCG